MSGVAGVPNNDDMDGSALLLILLLSLTLTGFIDISSPCFPPLAQGWCVRHFLDAKNEKRTRHYKMAGVDLFCRPYRPRHTYRSTTSQALLARSFPLWVAARRGKE